MRLGWHSTARQDAPAIVAASGCAPPMPPRPAVRIQLPGEVAAIVLAAHLDEGLVGALHDALRADVDPGAGRHLAVHHQPLAIELVEVLPGRPVRHEVGVGDQHARRVRHACGTRRPACRTGPAASGRPRAASARRRCGRSSPSRARRGRCRHRRRARSGCSATSGSRLFISMRSGASVSQLLAESSVPARARMTRLLSMRVMRSSSSIGYRRRSSGRRRGCGSSAARIGAA